MRQFVRDLFVAAFAFGIALLALGWWNKPAYQACAKSHSQEFCYTVLK